MATAGEVSPRTDEAWGAFPGSAGILPAAGRRPAMDDPPKARDRSSGQDARAPGKPQALGSSVQVMAPQGVRRRHGRMTGPAESFESHFA